MKLHAKTLLAICGHLGTHKFNWQPESERFAIGYRASVLIYNLSNSSFYLNRALNFVEKLIFKYGRLYVYGLNTERDKKFIKNFSFINQVVATDVWRGGFVTNARTFRNSLKNVKKRFSAIVSFSYDYQNYSLPREAHIINIPAISVVDSNVRAENFSYPIPINSTSFGGIRVLAYNFGICIFKGLSKRIVSRFSKKKKLLKIKGKKRKSVLKFKYFKKIRRLAKSGRRNVNIQLLRLIKKFKKLKYKERRRARFLKQRKIRTKQLARKNRKKKSGKLKKIETTLKPKKVVKNTNLKHEKKKYNKNKWFQRYKNKKFKQKNKFKFGRKRSRVSRFARIKKKLVRLKKIKLFKKVLKAVKKNKSTRLFVRRFKKTITAYKYVSIYSYLHNKKIRFERLKKLKIKRQKLYKKKKQEKNKKRYRYYYYNNIFIKKLKKKKSYFPLL